MKKWIYNIGWVMMAFVTLSLTSCDDDADIARTLEGTWEGNMYASTYYNNRYYDATYSQVCFLRDPYTYSSGTGYWVDYYDNNYWGKYNYVASHIEFTVTESSPSTSWKTRRASPSTTTRSPTVTSQGISNSETVSAVTSN